jgi:hypothetical protein
MLTADGEKGYISGVFMKEVSGLLRVSAMAERPFFFGGKNPRRSETCPFEE